MPNVRHHLNATPTAVASIELPRRWPNPVAERFLSPIFTRPNGSARLHRMRPSDVLHGFYFGTGPAFAECNAQPVINSAIELAAWDGFASSAQWTGGYALNVDTGKGNLGLSMQEAAALAPRIHVSNHGITLPDEQPGQP